MNPRPPLVLALFLAVLLAACGGSSNADPTERSGSAAPAAPDLPVQRVDLGPIDPALVAEGQQVYETRCTTCHRFDERYVGPPLGDVVAQRSPEYIMNMVLAPEKMLQSDPTARQLLAEYGVPMTNQNLTEAQARAILEYLRHVHEPGA